MGFEPNYINVKNWKCHVRRGDPVQVQWAFGHDLSEMKLWIVEQGTGRKVCDLSTAALTSKEMELCARIVRSAPIFVKTLTECERRLYKASHPNAVRLRILIHDALRSLELPLLDDDTDRSEL